MYDKEKVIPGIVLFLALVTFPVWYNVACGNGVNALQLQVPAEGKCVESKNFMRRQHMTLLNQWRDAVVRDGYRMYVSSEGQPVEMSLTKTCLGCHTSKAQFCDRCHDYMAVKPYCWQCHIAPME